MPNLKCMVASVHLYQNSNSGKASQENACFDNVNGELILSIIAWDETGTVFPDHYNGHGSNTLKCDAPRLQTSHFIPYFKNIIFENH